MRLTAEIGTLRLGRFVTSEATEITPDGSNTTGKSSY